MHSFLDFEQSVAELESKIDGLRATQGMGGVDIQDEIKRLEDKVQNTLQEIYENLDPWRKVQVARHPARPKLARIIDRLIEDYEPLAGDRTFGEDAAIGGGIGRFNGRSVVVMGTEKGSTTEDRLKHNFGMARPEGYRKARRLMEMAERFNLPLLSFVDTAGAYPGVGAEERGQAEAIARAIETGLQLRIPFVAAIVGEGGSGGAIALAAANRVLMLEHAVYSVISPEGCASILWRSADHAKEAATALRLTAQEMERLKVADRVIEEPLGGAHRDVDGTIDRLGAAMQNALDPLVVMDGDRLRQQRRARFLALGQIESGMAAE
ncbi:MAG: acetyl-CoA carboxylase carboxyltransferase subunit alpha [Alphaproteobacteria bacterium]|nr:acetyl-CoA carboxylase carboxyltransferase subunit alpha [Alphaproteobacteria bacterium]